MRLLGPLRAELKAGAAWRKICGTDFKSGPMKVASGPSDGGGSGPSP